MFHNLEAEMARSRVTVKDIAKCINKTEKSVRNKLQGIRPFTWPEIVMIRDSYFPDMDLQYLFDQSA